MAGKGENKLGKLLERVRSDALAGKDTEAWCAARFDLAPKLDVAVEFTVTKAGDVVGEPAFEGQPIIRMGVFKLLCVCFAPFVHECSSAGTCHAVVAAWGLPSDCRRATRCPRPAVAATGHSKLLRASSALGTGR